MIELRAILPKPDRIIDPKKLEANIVKALGRFNNIIYRDFLETTETWDEFVVFERRRAFRRGRDLVSRVATNNKTYRFVSEGVAPHPIIAKSGGTLAFPGGYRAKTSRGSIKSRAGGKFGAKTFRKAVMHPGIQAREFPLAIAKKRRVRFGKMIQDAINISVT